MQMSLCLARESLERLSDDVGEDAIDHVPFKVSRQSFLRRGQSEDGSCRVAEVTMEEQ